MGTFGGFFVTVFQDNIHFPGYHTLLKVVKGLSYIHRSFLRFSLRAQTISCTNKKGVFSPPFKARVGERGEERMRSGSKHLQNSEMKSKPTELASERVLGPGTTTGDKSSCATWRLHGLIWL